MIAPLRARHRRVTTALAVTVPILYVLALGSRLPGEQPAETINAPTGAVGLSGEAAGSAWRDGSQLWFLPDGDPALPDVLLYWSPAVPGAEELPTGSHLLGSLDGDALRALALPPQPGGHLVAYSLGHARVVGSGPAPKETD